MRTGVRVLAMLAAFILAPLPIRAMTVTPVHIEMSSAGLGSRAQFTVTNDGKEALPIEIGIQALQVDEVGNRSLGKVADQFLLFPPQALIAPGGSQNFRIQWVGEPELARSLSFMASANQIPVKLPRGQSAVQIVMSFGVMINVAPPKGAPALSLIATGSDVDKKTGKLNPTVTVSNASNTHALLSESVLKVVAGNWVHTFSAAEMREKVGIGLVQPGKKRKFVLPVDLPPGVTKVEATLDYKPKRN